MMENYLLQFDAVNSMDTDYRVVAMLEARQRINYGAETIHYDRGWQTVPGISDRLFDTAHAAIEYAKTQTFRYGFVLLQSWCEIAHYRRVDGGYTLL